MDFIIILIAILFSIILHELAHGFVADRLGDPTPRMYGRLTLNPTAHLDFFGSLLLPLLLLITNAGILFGWAKPVPINPNNLRDPRGDEIKVALAGPLTNFLIAAILALVIRLTNYSLLNELTISIIQLNLVLGLFNLLPIPPLDGSKILGVFLPESVYYSIQRMGFALGIIILFLLLSLPGFNIWLSRSVEILTRLFVGV